MMINTEKSRALLGKPPKLKPTIVAEEPKVKEPKLVVENKEYYTYEDYPIEDLLLYAGIDCIVTSGLASKLSPIINDKPKFVYYKPNELGQVKQVKGKAPSIIESYAEYSASAQEFILDMELNGILYDVKLNGEIKAKMRAELDELEESIFTEIGTGVDLNSGTSLGKFLYGDKGLEVSHFTKFGDPSTDGEALRALEKKYGFPWLTTIAKRNDINSLYGTFVENYVRDFVKGDGRIHPSYNMFGTSSFRISGSSPNLTQLPRPKHGYNLRRLYTVEEGNVFIAVDFSSAEVKILGALSKDPSLLKAIAEGLDFHSFSASKMAGIEYEVFVAVVGSEDHPLKKQYKEMRQRAKILTFSILYGSSPAGIAMQLGLSKEEGSSLIELYFSIFPGIRAYVEASHLMAKDNFFIVNPFGQRKQQFGVQSVFKGTAAYNAGLRNSQNVWTQGTTSSFGLHCFAQANEAIKKIGGKSLSTVYDSLEIEVPIEKAAEALEILFYELNDRPLETFDWLTLPVGVEAEIGFNWGDAKVVERGSTQEELMVVLNNMKRG